MLNSYNGKSQNQACFPLENCGNNLIYNAVNTTYDIFPQLTLLYSIKNSPSYFQDLIKINVSSVFDDGKSKNFYFPEFQDWQIGKQKQQKVQFNQWIDKSLYYILKAKTGRIIITILMVQTKRYATQKQYNKITSERVILSQDKNKRNDQKGFQSKQCTILIKLNANPKKGRIKQNPKYSMHSTNPSSN
ncbi:hypothetical protein ABPG72_020621 [Tetrahymena utriculariae]